MNRGLYTHSDRDPSGLRFESRTGGVLICAMVVLLLVGLLSAQTLQSLMVIRRSDSDRSTLRQARELLELGRIAARQASEPATIDDAVVQLEPDLVGKISVHELPVPASGDPQSGEPIIRVDVQYPAGKARELTTSWQGSK